MNILVAVLLVSVTTTCCVHASAVGNEADSLWKCPTLVADGDDNLIREPTACVHFDLGGRKGTLVHVPFADLTLEAATRVFLRNYFSIIGASSEERSFCASTPNLHALFSSPRAPLTPMFIEMVAAGVFRGRWVSSKSSSPSSDLQELEKSAYDCLSQQHRNYMISSPSAKVDDIVSVERGVFTGDLFLGRTPGGEILEGLSDGEDDDYTDGSSGDIGGNGIGQQQGGGSNVGAKSTLSWGDGEGMLIYSQDSFVDPFKPAMTVTTTPPSSSTSVPHQRCVMNKSTTTTNCRNEITCATSTDEASSDNDLVTLLRRLPVSFDTSTSRYVSGHHFDEIHFSTHIIITTGNDTINRIRVTAVVSLDIVNEAPVGIDSTVRVAVPMSLTTTNALSISIPIDFQHFKAYDADFQKLRNDFELHHINLVDTPVTVVGDAGVVCTTSGHHVASASASSLFGDNAATQGFTSVMCHLPTTAVSSLPLNISWYVLQRPCGEGRLDVTPTTSPNDASAPSSSSAHSDPTPVNAATQGSPSSMPRCLSGGSRTDGGSAHSESLVVTVTSPSTDLLRRLLEAGGVAVSFPFMVWDSEGVYSKHLAYTTLLINPLLSTDNNKESNNNSPLNQLTPLPHVTSPALLQAFSQSAATTVIRPVSLREESSFYIPSLTTIPLLPDGVDTQMLKVVSVVEAPSCEGVRGMFELRSTGRSLRIGDVLLGSKGDLDGLVQFVPCASALASYDDSTSAATAALATGGGSESLSTTLRALSNRITKGTLVLNPTCVCHSSVSFRTASGESFTVRSPSPGSTPKVHKQVQDVSIVLPTLDNVNPCAPLDIPIRIRHATANSLHLLSGLSNTSWLRSPPSSSSSLYHLAVSIGTLLPPATSPAWGSGCSSAVDTTVVVVRITPQPHSKGSSCQNVWRYANMLSNTNAVETFTLLVGGGDDGLPIVLQVNIRLERRMEGSSTPTVRIPLPEDGASMTVLRIDHGPKDRSPLTIGAQEQVSLAVRRLSSTVSNHGALDETPNSRFGVVKGGSGFGVASTTFGADAFGKVLMPVSHVVSVTASPATTTTTISGVVSDSASISSTAPLAAVMELAATVRVLLTSPDSSSTRSTNPSSHSTSAMCLWLSHQQQQTTSARLPECKSVANPSTGAQSTVLSIPLRYTSAFHCDTISAPTSSTNKIQCAFHIDVLADSVLVLFQQVVADAQGGVEYLYAANVGVVDVGFEATLPTLENGKMSRFVVTRSPPALIRDFTTTSSSSPLSSKRLYSPTSTGSPNTTPLAATSTATETSADVVVVFTTSEMLDDGSTNSTTNNSNTTYPNATNTTLPPPSPAGDPNESAEYDPSHPDGYHIAKACLTVAGVFVLLLLVKYQQMIMCAQYFMRTFQQSNALRQATREATRRVHKRKRAKSNNKKRLINEGDTSEDGVQRRSSSFLSFFGVQHSAFSDDDEYEVESDEEASLTSFPEQPQREVIGGGGHLEGRERLGGQAGGISTSNPTSAAGFEGVFTPREEAEEDLGDSFGQYRRASIFGGGKEQQPGVGAPQTQAAHYPSTANATASKSGAAKPSIKTAAAPSSVWSEGTPSSGQRSPLQTVPPPQRRKKPNDTGDIIGDSQI